MTTPLDLTDAEKRQLHALYTVYLNPMIPATYVHDVCDSLILKHLAEDVGDTSGPLVRITARGIEIARTL